jgi:CSLREA domain-containing protein
MSSTSVISGSGFGITKTGAGTLTLGAANTFTGGVTINAGTLTAGSTTALGPAASVTLTFGSGSTGKFQLNGNNTTVVGLNTNATIGSPIIENGLAGTSTLTANIAGTNTYAGVLQNGSAGILALTKDFSGTLTLSGTNTYTGTTTISNGTLLVNGSTASGSAVTVNGGGATLGGSGTVGGSVTVANGTIGPGASAGTLTTGSINFTGGSAATYKVEIGSTSSFDKLVVNGGVTLNGARLGVFAISGYTPTSGDSFLIIDNDGTGDAVSGMFDVGTTITNFLGSGLNATVNYAGGDGNDVVLTVQSSSLKYRSKQTGNWNDFNTWQVNPGSGFVNAISGQTPTSADDTIEIQNGHTVTVTANVAADQLTVDAGGTLAINSGITLTIDNGADASDLAINGTVNVADTGVVAGAGTVAVNNGGTLGVASSSATDGLAANVTAPFSLNTGSTVNYNGTGAQTIGARQYQNLTVSNARSGSPALTFASGTVAIANNFSYTTTGVGSVVETGNTIEYNGTVSNQFLGTAFLTYNNLKSNRASTNIFAGPGLVINGTLEIATGTFQISGPGTSDLNTVNIETAASELTLSANVTISGDFTNNGTLTPNNHTVTFDGGNAQAIATGGAVSGKLFGPVIVNKTAGTTATLAGDLSDTTLSITGGTFDQGTSFNLVSGAVTVSGGAFWRDVGAGNVVLSGGVANAGTININGGTDVCGESQDISISSTAGQRAWSGNGTFVIKDVHVSNQGGTALIHVENGSNDSGNGLNWIFTPSICTGGTLYTWKPLAPGTDSNYTTQANWTPTRVSQSPDDVLVVDGAVTPTTNLNNIPTETIGRFRFINGTSVTLTSGSANILTIKGEGTSVPDLDVAGSSQLTLSGTAQLTVSLPSGANGNIDNLLTFDGSGGSRLVAVDTGAVTFMNTNCTTLATYSGSANPFGTAAAGAGPGSIVFQSGSAYTHHGGSSPFGAATDPQIVNFQPGSTARWYTASGFQANGRTYGTLEIGDGTTPVSVSDTGADDFTFYGLTINNATGGTFPVLSYTGTGPSTVNVRGNVASNGGSGNAQDIRLGGGSGGVVLDGAGSISLTDNSGNSRAIEFTSNASVTSGTAIVSLFRKVLLGQAQPSNLVLSVPAASVINPAGNTNYVIGKVLMNFDASHTSHTFPVGNATSEGYSPLVVSNASGTGSLTVNARSPGLPAISGANKLNRYWQITKGGSLASADLAFHYPASAAAAGAEANYKFFRYDSGNVFTAYDVSSLTTTDPNDHIATLNGVTNFSDWTLAEPSSVPSLSIDANVSQAEGDSGQANMTFNVNLSPPSGQTVTVHYSTADGTATGGATCGAGTDYVTTSGTLTFTPSVTAQTINVPICGDKLVESNETLTVTIDTPINALITSATGTGTISNDDHAPVASSFSDSTAFNTLKTITLSASDTDGDALTFSVVGSPSQGSLSNFGTPSCAGGTCTETVDYTPTTGNSGTDSFTYKANDGANDSNTATVSITVNCPTITLSPSLPDGQVSVPYSQLITASGGAGPYTFTTTSGSLPDGLTLETDGTLHGTPTVANTFTFTVTATGSHNCTGSQPYTITIAPAPVICPGTLTVNNTGDGSDATPGDGLCETASPGVCTLRAAIQEANAEGSCPTPIEIHFSIASPGLQTISPASPLPAVTVPVIIDGYSQPGTSVNTLSDSTDNAVLLIELTGVNAGVGADGIVISGGGSTVEGLIINRFLGAGVKLTGAGTNNVTGNFIGTDATGMLTVDGSNVPYGNHVGVLIDNTGDNMIGCDTEDERNVISGNVDDGINIAGATASQNLVWGNLIGVGAGGSALANGGAGVAIYDASDNSVGVDIDGNGRGNFIGFNGGNGVEVKFGTMIGPAPPTDDNIISQNLIHDNVGLGIDLGDPGVTPNDETSPPFDSDSGPNDLQNFPEINVATAGPTNTIGGNLHSTPDQTFTIEFFASTSCNAVTPSDYGEGQMYLGSASVSTDGNGDTPFIFNPSSLTAGQVVTATATDANGNTSEFSQCFPVTPANASPTITAATGLSRQQGSPQSNSIIATVNDTESGPNGVTVTVTSANPANGVTISNIQNANDNSGHITADINADCTATDPATFTLQASDGSGGSATDTLTITITPKTAPTLTYNTTQTVTEGNSLTINPATGPSGNTTTISVQDAGGYPGTLSVDNSTGVVTVNNAVSPGSYTIKIRATGNCADQTDATFTLTVNAAACDTPPAGMVAWYPGDGNADDIQGPTFESGTLQGAATFSAGKVNQAFAFDGADTSYVEVPDSASLDSTTGTWNFWIKTTQTAGGGNPIGIMSKANSVASLSGATVFTSTGTISVTFKDDTSGSGHEWNVDGTRIINDGQWHHVAITFQAGGTANLYTDGTPDGNAPIGNFTLGAFPLRLARNTDTFWQAFNGQLDEVDVFNVELSASDVANIYNASFAGKCRTCTAPPTNMVSWWDGSGAGTTANDIAGSNPGTLQNGATFAPGQVGQGFSFDGVDDQIQIAHNANQNTGAQITVDAWIHPTAFAPLNSNPSIINKRTAANAEGYTFEVNNAGNGLYFEITTSNGVFSATAANALTLNIWQHVAATYDGANLKIFLNGNQVASNTGTGTINAVTSDLVIGRNIALGTSFTGQIDEVELFNRALSQTEIATIADAGSTGKCHTSTVTVAVSPSAVLEDDAANLVYTFTRSGDLTSPLTVSFSVGGTATFSSDYTQSGAATFSASAGTVDFPANTSTATVTIDPTPDTTYELAESVMLTVSSSANYSVGSPGQATGTINNDDDAPVLKIGNITAFEGTNPPGTTPFTFTVTKTGSTEATATVNFDTADGATNPAAGGGSCGGSVDYISQTGGVISFAPNETSKTLTIQVCRDATAEANETFLVELSAATHATIAEGEGRGTIQNDDTPPPLSPVNTTDDTNDGVCNATHCSLREAINQANLASTPVSITFAIPDDDHLNAGGPRHFYYKNDGVANHVTNDVSHIGITLTSDATPPADIDPDWPHSWWSIQTSSALPTVSAQSLISIDAYTQTGAAANTLTAADNAVLRIELTPGGSVPASTTGLSLSGLTASVKGLVVNRFSGDGVRVASGNKSLTGNFIGTDVSGTLNLGNTGSGINSPSGFSETIGGGTAADINLISGNNGNGLSFNNSNTNLILGNLIGTKADGAGSLGNSGTGISFSGPGSVANTIGGTNSGEGNTIAFNGADGVRLADASFGNGIRGNSIFSNGSTANDLGIDLGADGVTANDSMDGDTGPNALQNFPVITLAQVTGSTRTINGTLNSTPNETFNIDFYSNASCDTLGGYGEGKTYLGSISVTTDNTTGDASFTFHPTTLTIGQVVTATATSTGAQFNTSEFSACVAVQSGAAGAGDIQFTSATYTVNENDASQIAQITLTRAGGTNGQIQTSFTTSNGSATAGSDYTDSSQTVVFNEGETSKTINIPISDDAVYEGNETINLTLGATTINAPVGGKGNAPSLDPHVAVLTIVENDPAPTLAIDDVTQNEGSGGTTTFTFHITKTGATDLSASVTVNTANGTASAPADYAAITNQLVTFPASGPGSTTQTVAVTVTADATTETDETFFVNLSSPTNATISDSQGLGTITNDDTDVSVAISSPVAASVAEDGATNLVYRFTRAGVTSNSLTVNFSVGGTATFNTDYTQSGATTFGASSGTLTFGAGNSTADITIDPTADTNPESDETVILTVTSGSGYNVASPSAATGTITNDDACPTSFIVNGNGDASDTNAGDGHCDTDGNPGNGDQCTLRAAIEEANALTTCSGTIDINFSGVTSPIDLNTALPAINHNVNINGPGASALTVQRSAASAFRIFNINSGATVNISGLTVANGSEPLMAGGIQNAGTLTLTKTAVSNNSTSLGPGGGGIFNTGTLTITNSTISGNGTVTNGGGINNGFGATLTLVNSTVSGNSSNNGGGIYNQGAFTSTNSTISSNASDVGGGIFRNSGTTILKNTIVVGNVRRTSSTTRDDINGAVDGSSSFNLIGDGTGMTGISNGASGNQIGTSGSPINALLGPLANNGGPTMTHALLPGSPAINAGSNGNLPTTDPFDLDGDTITNEQLPVDQRGVGFNRIVNTTVDIGAFESRGFSISATGGTPQTTTILTSFASPLVATVTSAFGEPVVGGVVTFTAPDPNAGPSATFPGPTSIATQTINGSGAATSPTLTANTSAGSYNVVASIGSTLPTASFALTNKASTLTQVSSSPNPSQQGQNVTFTASVSTAGGTPTGTVQFKDGGTNLGAPQTLDSSFPPRATISTTSLTPGTHTITAEYSGDTNFNPSSGTLSGGQVVNQPSLSINDVSMTEGDSGTKNFTFTVTLSAASTLTVTVDCASANGSATAGSDYVAITPSPSTLTFTPGQTTRTISVTVNGDQTFESNETFFVNLSNATNATISDNQGLGTIVNDDAQGGVITFSQSNYTVNESGGSATITVNRTGDTSGSASVDYATPDDSELASTPSCATVSGIAQPRCDFTTALGTLQFAPGESSKTFTVLISQDNFAEGSEGLQLTLSNLTGGAVFGANSTAVLTINDDPTEPPSNPIDDPENFVRQHYHDFLNREPDAPGLAFWIGNITECGSNAQCIEVKRINVSAAFYLSIEFQQTGYLVERVYKSAYGDVTASSGLGGTHPLAVPVVRYSEFLRDTQKIGEGVIVNTDPNWQQKLEANKVKFAEDFVQRQRFTNAYPTTLSPDTFVNQLFANTGVTPSAQERQDAINEFGGAPNISNVAARARATRRIAENGTFTQQEFNRAFVLMQYFGYLRRNPNAEASADYTGFDFWLTKLNQFGGNFQNAEMVKAFISSIEYRNRFGN